MLQSPGLPLKLGIIGFDLRELPSINRTAEFYLNVLQESFEIVAISTIQDTNWNSFAGIIDFGHRMICESWRPDLPIIYVIHGTAARGLDKYALYSDRLRRQDTFFVNCHADAAILRASFEPEPSVAVIDLPIGSAFTPQPKSRARSILDLPSDALILGFVARLIPQKNVHRFLDTLRSLRQIARRPPIGIIIGTPVDYSYLDWYDSDSLMEEIRSEITRLNAESQVYWIQHSPDDRELATYYSAFSWLFHPTNVIDENFGYVPLEALACGTKVVATEWGGLKDTLRNNAASFYLPTWVTRGGIRSNYSAAAEWIATDSQENDVSAQNESHIDLRDRYSRTSCATNLRREISLALNRHPIGGQFHFRPLAPLSSTASHVHELGPLKFLEAWKKVLPYAAYYSSRYPPRLDATSTPVADCRLTITEDLRCHLNDAAWPVQYKLSLKAMEILNCCTGQSTLLNISRRTRYSVKSVEAIANELVESGILIG